ncbi:MAG: hypothetical protein DMG28_17455 [Acidobacteria bacterium]|nr:MAG: hypothetical protein DMG28_17455 [Acidobacteriota bacterium]
MLKPEQSATTKAFWMKCRAACAVLLGWQLLVGLCLGQEAAPSTSNAPTGLPKPGDQQMPALEQQALSLDYDLTLSATEPWSDTGIDLRPGDAVRIVADSGASSQMPVRPRSRSQGHALQVCNPEGLKLTEDVSRDLPVQGALPGALIGKFGTGRVTPFYVGRDIEVRVAEPRHLFLGVNTDGEDFCEGIFRVNVRIIPPQPPSEPRLPAVPSAAPSSLDDQLRQMIDRLPRRNSDASGHPGDMANFILIGSALQVQQALAAAGWVVADRGKGAAAMHALVTTSMNQNYLAMPMSQLYLFGRTQDYGYEQAEPYKVVASRHHFRIWKAPWEAHGQVIWVGAGTHDIGFEKDHRNGLVTHKIDPEVDREREYIAASLQQAAKARWLTYLMPAQPLQEAQTATGGRFRTDGRIW